MKRFKNILTVVSPEGASAALVERIRWLADMNGATVTLVDVVDRAPGELSRLLSVLPGLKGKEVEQSLVEQRAAALDDLAGRLREMGVNVSARLLRGIPFIEIIRHAMAHDNDLVLKEAELTPVRSSLRGPDLHLLRKCPCPVWILNSANEPNSRRILAAVDPDPEDAVRDALNHKVLQLATSLARHDGSQVHVVNGWYLEEETALRSALVNTPEDDIQKLLAKMERESAARLKRLTDDFVEFGDIIRVVHVKGNPADVITQHAESERIDTVVMGTLGRTRLSGFFIGNTADTVLNRVGCSVVAVKPDGFTSPVTLQDAP